MEEAARLLPDISSDWPCLDQRFALTWSAVVKEVDHVWGVRMTPTRCLRQINGVQSLGSFVYSIGTNDTCVLLQGGLRSQSPVLIKGLGS